MQKILSVLAIALMTFGILLLIDRPQIMGPQIGTKYCKIFQEPINDVYAEVFEVLSNENGTIKLKKEALKVDIFVEMLSKTLVQIPSPKYL